MLMLTNALIFSGMNLPYMSWWFFPKLMLLAMQVYRQIVKLVLRNNALTTLRGIENLQSLEGLDLSYNILSNFSELEILSGLLSLKSLWLEGNPLCSARWYRPQVFSFFPHPDEVRGVYITSIFYFFFLVIFVH